MRLESAEDSGRRARPRFSSPNRDPPAGSPFGVDDHVVTGKRLAFLQVMIVVGEEILEPTSTHHLTMHPSTEDMSAALFRQEIGVVTLRVRERETPAGRPIWSGSKRRNFETALRKLPSAACL